ncbi:hypothetical protein [Ruficoccus sp. ZRK36]|uniref:hypothetical protein n=1 Tax=Ruficoccus sp. ZRK36 TaxID=2866311 RepID=UPI001C737149|nr:hypothetical protein [Ruficoccus sp. ZRK36]QYY34470.1 hypothetical protein K0V07_09125 [Ruficoccus sp. ZRK36]
MNTTENAKPAEAEKKPGLFKRLFNKLDQGMKAKADEKASSGCCCGSGSKDGKGGSKCC